MDKTDLIYKNLAINEDEGHQNSDDVPYEIECSNCRHTRIIYSNDKWLVAQNFEEEGWDVNKSDKIVCPECV